MTLNALGKQMKMLLKIHLKEYSNRLERKFGKEKGINAGEKEISYSKYIEFMKLKPSEFSAIEDAEDSLNTALAVGIPTAIFYNDIIRKRTDLMCLPFGQIKVQFRCFNLNLKIFY